MQVLYAKVTHMFNYLYKSKILAYFALRSVRKKQSVITHND